MTKAEKEALLARLKEIEASVAIREECQCCDNGPIDEGALTVLQDLIYDIEWDLFATGEAA